MIRRLVATREMALFVVLVAVLLAFSVLTKGFNAFGAFDRSRYWVVTGMIAVPMTFIIATAGIDLSVGSMVALSGIVLGLVYRDAGWPIGLAACVGVLTGLIAGACNGAVISYIGVPPLVVTLATMALFRGIAMGLSKAEPIKRLPAGFLWLGRGDAFAFRVGDAGTLYFPVCLFALIASAAVGWVLLRKTWVGRFAECIGENETAAEFAAIDPRRVKFGLYAACGAVCGLASVFQTALYATAKADTAAGLELEVIACVVVGGTRISGGRGSVTGSILGLLVIGVLRYGLEIAGMKSQYIIIVVGGLLIIMAVLNEWIGSNKGERE